MAFYKIVLLSCVTLLATGCVSVRLKENLVVLEQGYFLQNRGESNLVSEKSNINETLTQAYKQVTLPTFKIAADSKSVKATEKAEPLPYYLAKEPLIQKIVIAAYEAIEESKDTVVEVSTNDIKSMISSLNEHFSPGTINRTNEYEDSQKKIYKIIRKYLNAYYSEKSGFVNREGVVFKRAEIKNSAGNDVSTAIIAISLEGLFDGLLSTPIYVDGTGKFQTNEGLEPSAHYYKYANPQKIVANGEAGIDTIELKAIRFLSGFAGDQSKTLSGAVYRAFGGLEISFVIGGKFSLGDNDTIAKMLDTSFEIASKRIVEESAYRGFSKLTVNYPFTISEGSSKAELLLKNIE